MFRVHNYFLARAWIADNLSRQFTVRYLPFTQSIEVVDSFGSAANMIEVYFNFSLYSNNIFQELKLQVTQLSAAFEQIGSN